MLRSILPLGVIAALGDDAELSAVKICCLTPTFSDPYLLVRLYTEAHPQWMRVVDWAKRLPLVPLEEILATAAKRSAERPA